MADWREYARTEVMLSQFDPDRRPLYKVPNRRWWELWKPRWRWVEGLSVNMALRAHGLPPQAEPPMTRTLGEEIDEFFGFTRPRL